MSKVSSCLALVLLVFILIMGSALGQQVIKVGYMPITPELPLHAAIANGYFEQEGIKVQVEAVAGGAEAIPAIVGGSLQVSHSAYIAVIKARDVGLDIKVVYPYARHTRVRDTTAILVRADSPITTAKGLEGKTVALNVLKDLNWLYLAEWMAIKGANPNEVNLVELPFPSMVPALRQGRVDAVANAEPFVTLEMEKGGLRVLEHYFTMVDPAQEVSGLVAGEKWLTANRDLAERFVRALRKGTDYVNTHSEKWPELLAKYTRLRPEWVSRIKMPEWRYPISLDRLQFAADLALKWGLIKKRVDAREVVWPTALR